MKTILRNVLSLKNHHIRDDNILFFEEDHRYVILSEPNVKYTSVTTWVHSHFPKFDSDAVIKNMMKGKGWKQGHKYWGLTAEQIKSQWSSNASAVSGAGTDLHYEIECFNNNIMVNSDYSYKELYENYMLNNNVIKPIEWHYFINFVKDMPYLKPYRTEWIIYHEDVKISGSVDMIYENYDGTYSIYDWKRSKNITRINTFNKFAITPEISEFPDANFWHYALQLNTYKVIIEEKYGKIIKDIFLVRLHPDAEEENYELIPLPDLTKEVKLLFLERKMRIENETI